MPDPSLIFILGGARSGKSDYALQLAKQIAVDDPVLFIATAQAGDAEMAERIVRHRRERPEQWRTLEANLRVGKAWQREVARAVQKPPVAILDCITLLVSNALFAGEVDPEKEDEAEASRRVMEEVDGILETHRQLKCSLIVVSNEVGLGIVPVGYTSRLYRDLIGRTNRRLASMADHAVFMVAGIPLDLTRLQSELPW